MGSRLGVVSDCPTVPAPISHPKMDESELCMYCDAIADRKKETHRELVLVAEYEDEQGSYVLYCCCRCQANWKFRPNAMPSFS